jgi:hypothetical protein
MTYCAGWKYGNSVYLFGDTAATKSSPPISTHSSFGELHAKVGGKHVEESLLKVVPIEPGAAVAFAGDVQLATEAIKILQANYRIASDHNTLFSSLTASLGPFDRNRPVEVLLAGSTATGESQLLHWDTIHGLDPNVSNYYEIGSLTSYHSALTPQVLAHFIKRNLAPDRVLSLVTAVVQSYGIHDNLMEMNVGGIIFGLQTHAGSVSWQEDTSFVLYDPGFLSNTYVSALVRDDVLVVNSSVTNDVRLLAHSASTRSLQDWFDTWHTYIKDHLESDRYRYWVFISTAAKVITVLRRDNFEQESRYVRLKAIGNGKFDMAMSPELMSLLAQPLKDRGDGSLPLRLNFRND